MLDSTPECAELNSARGREVSTFPQSIVGKQNVAACGASGETQRAAAGRLEVSVDRCRQAACSIEAGIKIHVRSQDNALECNLVVDLDGHVAEAVDAAT